MNHGQQPQSQTDSHGSRGKWVFIGFLLVAAYFLWAEHKAHLMGALPYLLILLCPVLHLFHHRHGHGHHQAHEGKAHEGGPGPADRR